MRGEVAVELRTDEPDRRFAAGAVLRPEGGGRTLVVATARRHAGRLLVRFDQLDDRDAVTELRGVRLVADVDAGERPGDAEEFYDRQLVGLRVLDAAGSPAGTVTAVAHLPSQDLLEVATPGGPRLVPFVSALVPVVDLAAGEVRLADVAGLLADEPD